MIRGADYFEVQGNQIPIWKKKQLLAKIVQIFCPQQPGGSAGNPTVQRRHTKIGELIMKWGFFKSIRLRTVSGRKANQSYLKKTIHY